MTVSTVISQPDVYVGNGVTVDFPTTFKVLQEDHIAVSLLVDGQTAETPQELNVDYSVTLGVETATVTMFTAPGINDLLSLTPSVPATQETDYTNNDPFDAETTESALDKLTLLTQQNTSLNSLALVFPSTDTGDKVLPIVSERADKLLGFDLAGEPVAVISGRAQVETPQTIILQAGQQDYLLNYQVNSRDDLWIQARGLDFYTNEYTVVQTVAPNDTVRFLIDLTEYDGYEAEIRYIGDALLTGQVADGAINSPDKFSNNPVDLNARQRGPVSNKTNVIEYDQLGNPAYQPRYIVGESKMINFLTPPSGWITEDGRELSRTTFAELFAAIGTTFGAGDGSTTFNIPNSQNRAAYGIGQGDTAEGGVPGSTRALGDLFGKEQHTQTESELVPHAHASGTSTLSSSDPGATDYRRANNSGPDGETVGGGQPFTIQGPGIAKHFIIYTGVET